MTAYVAFLRGINVGGNKKMSMGGLREALSADAFHNVRTLLASGNVLFEAEGAGAAHAAKLAQRIERRIEKAFAMEVSVVLRTRREIQRLLEADPFKGIRVTPNIRLFVTFLAEKPQTSLKIPYVSPDKSYKILSIVDRAVCSVLTLGPQWSKNLRQMDILEKEFGKRITTRSWNTVRKCCIG